MTIQTTARASRRTFPLSLAGSLSIAGIKLRATGKQHCSAQLSTSELRQLVAEMVD